MNAMSDPRRQISGPALEAFLSRAVESPATDVLRKTGLPSRREEAWRYTPLSVLSDVAFQSADSAKTEDAEVLARELIGETTGARIVFLNGVLSEDLSELPKGVDLTVNASPDGAYTENPIDVLNAALVQPGLTLSVPAGLDAGTIMVLSVCAGDGDTVFSTHLRHTVTVEQGASLMLRDISIGSGRYLANPAWHITVAQDGHLTHVKSQEEAEGAFHLSYVHADVSESGTYDSFTLTLGARLARHEVSASLGGAHAAVHVNAAQVLGGKRHADVTSLIAHLAPHCDSRQTVKNVIMDTANAVFQGKIFVDQIAQKTDGYQMNQALLLSDGARIDSKPELEIYADDVKCSHGATVGALDDEQLFYLQSRGIPADEARAILVQAFLKDALDLVADEGVRAWLDQRVERWWAGRSAQ